MKYCAYCKNILGTDKYKKTGEHIIPAKLIQLFPEQDISIGKNGVSVDNKGKVISDVCNICNNGILSILDAYGCGLIEKYFCTPFDIKDYNIPFAINIQPELFMRWILKIIYNFLRSDKMSTVYIEKLLPFIMGNQEIFPKNLSVFIGTHININPVPEQVFAYFPLQINCNPVFEYVSYLRQERGEKSHKLQFKGCGQSFSIRFASCIIFVILWKDTVAPNVRMKIENMVQNDFRFTMLRQMIENYTVRCVSSPTNVMTANYAHFFSEEAVQETIDVIKASIQGRDIEDTQKEFCKTWTEDMCRKGRALTELSMFPDNKKKIKQYEKYYKE